MSLMEFAKVILGLAIGVLVTGTIFVIGHAFIEIVFGGDKPDGFIIVMAVLIWITVSYGVIVWVM